LDTRDVPRNDADPAEIDHVARIFTASEKATTSTTVRVSWIKAGFEECKRDDIFYLVANDEKILNSPEFSEISRVDYPIEALSGRRRAHEIDEETARSIKTFRYQKFLQISMKLSR
jgi:hypothetical protein